MDRIKILLVFWLVDNDAAYCCCGHIFIVFLNCGEVPLLNYSPS